MDSIFPLDRIVASCHSDAKYRAPGSFFCTIRIHFLNLPDEQEEDAGATGGCPVLPVTD